MEKLNIIPLIVDWLHVPHVNKKMEIRNVDVSKHAFCGKGGYTTPLKYCEGGYSVGYRKKKTNFCRKRLGIIKVFNTGYYFNQGRRVDSI